MLLVAPDKHQNVVIRRLPWITFALIAINIFIFLFISFKGSRQDMIWHYGHKAVDPYLASYLTATFLHTGILHLLGNMVFLYLAGSSMEDLWGRPLYLCFYLSAGILAGIIYDVSLPDNETPIIGASAAIAGLMGAFIVRLYKTKITFVYPTTEFQRGTFQLPAWIVLPLWFVQLIFLSPILGEEADPAYLSHAAVFLFGGLFAFALNLLRFEERYINAFVERQIGTSSDAGFQQAIELSQRSELVKATTLLKQVIAQAPDHMGAHQELRRIAYLNGDDDTYRFHTGAMLEVLIRKRDHEAISELYRESQTNGVMLPARSLWAMGSYQEQIPDLRSALDVYQKLVDQHKEDPLVIKAYSRMARLCLEKFGDRRRGTELLEQAYRQTKNEEWRGILRADFKRYGISVPADAGSVPPVVNPTPATSGAPAPEDFHEIFTEESSEIALPNSIFEGQKRGWNPVECKLEKISDDGLVLKNQRDMIGSLKWNYLKGISVGRIRIVVAGTAKPEKDFLITDLISRNLPGQQPVVYRMNSQHLNLKKLFPEERNAMLAFKNMIELFVEKSFADCFPARKQCTGPSFQVFPSLSQYDGELRDKINSNEI